MLGLDEMEDAMLAGLLPVMNEVQAGGVIGGRIDSRVPQMPAFINSANSACCLPPSTAE